MSVHISLHVESLSKFLAFIREKRLTSIKDSGLDLRILNRLNLTGLEARSFTNKEITKVLDDYKYFEDFFRQNGLWPDTVEYLDK
jgi:hypothetical protein